MNQLPETIYYKYRPWVGKYVKTLTGLRTSVTFDCYI